GATGPTGPTGAGLVSALSARNQGTVTVGVGGLVPFATPEESFGTDITQTATTTFTISSPGYYSVRFILYTAALSLLGGAQIVVNGTPVSGAFTLISVGTPLVGEAMIEVTAVPSTIQIAVTGLALTLATGNSGHIQIEKLSN
ncbi:BclA C-terminal domain-containing protein, partial [Bacillus licheniformis]